MVCESVVIISPTCTVLALTEMVDRSKGMNNQGGKILVT